MFKHILVPLDGSRLAEAALPAAASVRRGGDRTGETMLLARTATREVAEGRRPGFGRGGVPLAVGRSCRRPWTLASGHLP